MPSRKIYTAKRELSERGMNQAKEKPQKENEEIPKKIKGKKDAQENNEI